MFLTLTKTPQSLRQLICTSILTEKMENPVTRIELEFSV